MQSRIRPKTDQAQNGIVLCPHNVRLRIVVTTESLIVPAAFMNYPG